MWSQCAVPEGSACHFARTMDASHVRASSQSNKASEHLQLGRTRFNAWARPGLPRYLGRCHSSKPGMEREQEISGPTTSAGSESQEASNNSQTTPNLASQLGSGLLLISPFFFWGTSMVAMKELAPHTSPIFVSAFRLLPAGVALVAWAAASGRQQPKGWQAWCACALFGLVDGTAFQGFLAEGLQRTSAGLGSVIIDSQPLTVAVLAALLFGEKLTSASYAGLGLGVLGLSLLEVPVDILTTLPQQALGLLPVEQVDLSEVVGQGAPPSRTLWDNGEWWMLLAAQSMALGTIMVRWVSKYVDPVMATGWHMLLGGLPLAALSLAKEGSELGPRLQQLTGLDMALLLYISLLGSAASYGVFFYNASKGNLTALSSLTFLTPMFAAGCGFLFLGEGLTPLQLGGATVTLGAVALLNSGQRNA
ncbi:hypothetical protein ABBQ38_015211 [Trebouxia sp. C0009 RCD-2024]